MGTSPNLALVNRAHPSGSSLLLLGGGVGHLRY
jgi:hypothetical protein